MLKNRMPLFSLFLLFLISPISLAELPEYQGVKPSPTAETEAQLPPLSPADKCCDRERNAHRDRDPHGLSPQEVLALVKKKKVLTPKPTTPPPADGSEGSR